MPLTNPFMEKPELGSVEAAIRSPERALESVAKNVRENAEKLRTALNSPEFYEKLGNLLAGKAADFLERAAREGGIFRSLAQKLGMSVEARAARSKESSSEPSSESLLKITDNCRKVAELPSGLERGKTARSIIHSISEMEKAGIDVSASTVNVPNSPEILQKLGIDARSDEFGKFAVRNPDGSVGVPLNEMKRALTRVQASEAEKSDAAQEAAPSKIPTLSEGTDNDVDAKSRKVIANGDKLKRELHDIKKNASFFDIAGAANTASGKIEGYLRANSGDLKVLAENRSSLDAASAARISSQIQELSEGLKKASASGMVPEDSRKKLAALLPAVEKIRSDFA